VISSGSGWNKKKAEQDASRRACEILSIWFSSIFQIAQSFIFRRHQLANFLEILLQKNSYFFSLGEI
jgi:hypothetical protein